MCLRIMVGSEMKNQRCVHIRRCGINLGYCRSDCSMCVLAVCCVCCVHMQCSLCALHKPAADLWVLMGKKTNALFLRTYQFPAFSPGLFHDMVMFCFSFFCFFFVLTTVFLLWYKVLVPGGLITVNLWRCGKMWWAPLYSSCVCPRWSDEDSKERAVSLGNSPQVYVYIQYLFIYFSVYLYVCLFLLYSSALKYSLVLFKGTMLCVEDGCFKGDTTPSLDTACVVFVTTNMVWISFCVFFFVFAA